MRPPLWVAAGPNGCGNSALAERYLAARLPIVNPGNLPRERPEMGAVHAGRLASERQRRDCAAGESFVWEATLSGKRGLALMRLAKALGYKGSVLYVCLRDQRASMRRVAQRVAAAVHHVPPADIGRRNVAEALAMADRALVFGNSGERRRLLLSRESGQTRDASKNIPRGLAEKAPRL